MHHPASLSTSLILTYSTDIPGLPRREKVSLLVHSDHSSRRIIVTAFSSLRKNHATAYFQYDWTVRDGTLITFNTLQFADTGKLAMPDTRVPS
jgi:hypothetical protein